MAEDKKSFILYSDLLSVVEKIITKDRENKTNHSGELFYHILQYVNDQDPIPVDFIVDMAFEPIKQQLKRDLKKYETIRKKRAEAGRKSAEARAALAEQNSTNPTSVDFAQQCSTNPTDTVNDNVNDSDTDNVTDTVNDISLLGADAQKKTNYSSDLNHPVYNQSEKEKKIPPKKEKVFGKKEFREVLIELGAHPQHVDDWIKVRSAKRAVFTLTVLESLVKECNDNALPVSDAVRVCAEQNWQGFKFNWYQNLKSSHGTRTTETRQSRIDSVQELAAIADSILAKSS